MARNDDDDRNGNNDDDRDRSRDDNGRDDSDNGRDNDDNGDGSLGGRDLAWRAYLKLAATILLTLILFTLILTGWTSCQGSSPITGQPVAVVAPAGG